MMLVIVLDLLTLKYLTVVCLMLTMVWMMN